MNRASFVQSLAPCWQPQTARICIIIPETSNVHTYQLELEAGEEQRFRFEAGQFNMLYLPGIGEAAISISSSPQQHGVIAHTARVAGEVTRGLARRQAGEQIALRGPFGTAWPLADLRGRDVLIVAVGIGLAPLRALLYDIIHARADFGQVDLVYGARTPRDLLYQQEFQRWRRESINVAVAVDLAEPGWNGHIGVVTELMQASQIAIDSALVLTCGPEVMMRFTAREALAMGAAAENIYLAMERNMNCAIGMCGHCQLGPYLLCRDGPIFTYDQIGPYLRLEDL